MMIVVPTMSMRENGKFVANGGDFSKVVGWAHEIK